MCRAIGRMGSELIGEGQGVLTHCNAGGLATADYGTALAVMFAAAAQGLSFHVYVDETRPLLQGARLTAWELQQRGIDITLICDNMAAQVMRERRVHLVIVGVVEQDVRGAAPLRGFVPLRTLCQVRRSRAEECPHASIGTVV